MIVMGQAIGHVGRRVDDHGPNPRRRTVYANAVAVAIVPDIADSSGRHRVMLCPPLIDPRSFVATVIER